jgi:hypothetical protein
MELDHSPALEEVRAWIRNQFGEEIVDVASQREIHEPQDVKEGETYAVLTKDEVCPFLTSKQTPRIEVSRIVSGDLEEAEEGAACTTCFSPSPMGVPPP